MVIRINVFYTKRNCMLYHKRAEFSLNNPRTRCENSDGIKIISTVSIHHEVNQWMVKTSSLSPLDISRDLKYKSVM